jgi:hypothetical protein
MKVVGIYIQDSETLEYNRVDLFDDEKINVTSSIQNINDIAKTYTDFSNTYTVPATKQNNKIFKHWYDNSNDYPFSTLTKSNAYIEIDTITFRKGKIQLESANVVEGQAQDYSITFIGILGNLKDTFAGKYLKDLTLNTTYDFNYSANTVIGAVVDNVASSDVMFPLISSKRRWNYGSITDSTNNINNATDPIRYNELFPAIRLRKVLNMIETQFGINFDGTTLNPSTFLSDSRFTNAYLYLKNGDEFKGLFANEYINFNSFNPAPIGFDINLTNDTFQLVPYTSIYPKQRRSMVASLTANTNNDTFTIYCYKNGVLFSSRSGLTTGGTLTAFSLYDSNINSDFSGSNDLYTFDIYFEANVTFTFKVSTITSLYNASNVLQNTTFTEVFAASQTTLLRLQINKCFPEIKIEDFFSGLLKMFNLTCYSTDGINYTVEQLESYYGAGSDIDITKYVLQDKKALNRLKTYKRINFEYEKSDSFINVAFESNAGIPYGSLRYVNNPITEGEEYSVKLPFEDLNFSNLSGLLQVGYCLKTDNQAYIPKPIILYDYSSGGTTPLTGTTFYTSTALTGNGTPQTQYKAFGQETLAYGTTYGLNFNQQQSTLTNEIVDNSLYRNYYEQYFANIYNLKARLIKVSAVLPTSILTTLKLNDNIIIRDAKYLINSYTTDLTTGLVQFELLTDKRVKPDKNLVLNLDAGIPESYTGTGTLWTDLSIYGNNGTLINGPTFDSANDGSIVFDGVDDYISVNNNSTINGTTQTVNVWFKNSGTYSTGNKSCEIIGKHNPSSSLNGYGIYISNVSGALIIGGYIKNATTAYGTITEEINNSNWYNVTITFSSNEQIKFYLNGILKSSSTVGTLTTNNELLRIGVSNDSFWQAYMGKIGRTLIYDRVLSSTEILANFNEAKGRYGL